MTSNNFNEDLTADFRMMNPLFSNISAWLLVPHFRIKPSETYSTVLVCMRSDFKNIYFINRTSSCCLQMWQERKSIGEDMNGAVAASATSLDLQSILITVAFLPGEYMKLETLFHSCKYVSKLEVVDY
ncbi:hypothetical protein TNCV_4819671 [Trichonephila clavipes]|nr:hypothetical protein TNCV_4819671 [Trichonephila clavipes]